MRFGVKPGSWRRPRRWGLPLLGLALLGLPGCGSLPWINGDTIYVMAVTQRRLDWLRHDLTEQRLWDPLLEEYQRLHPNVRVSLYTVDEDQVEEELRRRTSRGLGPDLLLVRGPMANTLLKEGLIAPVPAIPSMRRSIAEVAPHFLRRVRFGQELAGLPLHELVTLACFNRQRIPNPPRTTEELLATAAAGATIGLSIDPYGIFWTAGTRDVDGAIVLLLTGEAPSSPAWRREQEDKITSWLVLLRQLAQESKVDLASGPQELIEGLMASRLDWVPCYSLTLASLQKTMGQRLGVTALPSGPGGEASPFSTLQVWAFGLDSSPRQRRYAADLAALSVDPFLQRRFVLESQEVLPVNRTVDTPVASSGVLAALAEAQRQFRSSAPMLTQPFTVHHLNREARQLEAILQQVMVGVITPREGARQIMALGDQAR